MGKAVKKITNIFKPKKVNPQIASRELFDISKEVAPAQAEYASLLGRTRAVSEAGGAAPDVLRQMGEAALGRGPSLAEAQLKAAQDRNLAQQLAAVQGTRAGSSALGQRALLQSMGESGQNLAQQAAIARLQERNDFMNQVGAANQGLRSDISGKLNVDLMPKQSLQGWEQGRVASVNQAQAQNAAARNAMTGALLGGASSILGGMATGGTGLFAKAAGAAEGGLITKKGVVRKYKDGGPVVKTEDEKKKQPSLYEKLAGTFATTSSKVEEAKKIKEGEAYKRLQKQFNASSYKTGGPVDGPGTETSDSIPAMLSDGEFVIKAKVVKQPGILAHLEKLNAGKLTKRDLSSLAKALEQKNKRK